MTTRAPIKGYEGYYEMSEAGDIFSVDRSQTNSLGRLYTYKGQCIKPIDHGTGYQVVRLSMGNSTKTLRLHRVIAEQLIPNPDKKPYVNHIDGNRRNNAVENLEWVTAQENTDHAIATGLFNVEGFNNPNARFDFEDAKEMQRLLELGWKQMDIAELFMCGRGTVARYVKWLEY